MCSSCGCHRHRQLSIQLKRPSTHTQTIEGRRNHCVLRQVHTNLVTLQECSHPACMHSTQTMAWPCFLSNRAAHAGPSQLREQGRKRGSTWRAHGRGICCRRDCARLGFLAILLQQKLLGRQAPGACVPEGVLPSAACAAVHSRNLQRRHGAKSDNLEHLVREVLVFRSVPLSPAATHWLAWSQSCGQ